MFPFLKLVLTLLTGSPSQKPQTSHLDGLQDAALDSLSLFADLPHDYRPETDWLCGGAPDHPFFEDSTRIQDIIRRIKEHLLNETLEGCRHILNNLKLHGQDEIQNVQLRQSLDENPQLWKALISVQKYGVVYLANRADARNQFLPLINENPAKAKTISFFLEHDAVAVRAINYAVHHFVTRGGLKVENPTKLVPPNAISSIGNSHIAVRKQDFLMTDEELLTKTVPLWDLHDFAHLTTATLSPELFGNKYFDYLIKLEPKLTALIRSPGMRTGKGPKISDGIIFSELLTGIFTQEVDAVLKHQKQHSYKSLTTTLANTLADYLLGRIALHHQSTNTMIKLDTPISPTQLAVLAQNKPYELTASEIEQRVFARGGPDDRDPLHSLTAIQKIEYLAASRSWTYFEVRNTIKHRAHKEAYRLVAMDYIEKGIEVELCRIILESITYEDWRRGERRNLWSLFV
ncbi:hypothetical protein K440DRAFT_629330 [Wilcoxina mikolae CBS 423.85]|nr:hypothetical protein K440DRAFT_629330 [Wilcoxina mikolae CBS 423.85]